MNIEKISLSLLSFGETGMELITSQEVDNIDEDHVGMIGNFYSNVLGAAEQSTGLFGPLPIAYRYDLLLFLYAFNAFDPNLQDERVIKNNNITRASVLLFFPTSFDSVFSNQRKSLNTIIDQWSKPFLSNDIRKTSITRLNELKEKIVEQIMMVTNKLDYNNKELSNVVKIIGKHFSLLETVAFIYQKSIVLKFITNSDRLQPILKRSILIENIDLINAYSTTSDSTIFSLRNISIELGYMHFPSKNTVSKLKGHYDGIFLYFEATENAANSDYFISIIKNILDYSPKNTKITFCIENNLKTDYDLKNSEIPLLLTNQYERSISLVDLGKNNSSLETAIIDFTEKITSNY